MKNSIRYLVSIVCSLMFFVSACSTMTPRVPSAAVNRADEKFIVRSKSVIEPGMLSFGQNRAEMRGATIA